MTPLTTTVYKTWDALVDLLESLDYGTATGNPGGVMVHFGFPEDDVELGMEHVVVIGGVDNYTQEQATFARSATHVGRRAEDYDLLVVVTSAVPGATRREVSGRLDDMTSAIEEAIRASRSAPSGAPRPEVDGVDSWAVTSARPLVYGSKNGHKGRAELTISIKAHI